MLYKRRLGFSKVDSMKMCRLSVLLVLLVCVFAQKQAHVPTLDGRIVGGEDVQVEDYPYQISLLYYGSHICGGSIVSPNYVVTAAHCTDGSFASSLKIRAGSSILNSGGQVISLSRIHQNPSYNSLNVDYDISVLELAEPLQLDVGVLPIGLPGLDDEVSAGTHAFCTGWGTLSEGGSLPLQLQGVEVAIVNRDECRAAYGVSSITDRMICAGVPRGGKDACQGDSGGPLAAEGKLIGIVSWGYGCARPTHPGVYSNVAVLRSYINEVSGL